MKLFRRCLLVSLCLVFALSVFSANAFASEPELINQYNVYATATTKLQMTAEVVSEILFYPKDEEKTKVNWIKELTRAQSSQSIQNVITDYYFGYNDNSVMFFGGNTYDVTVGKVVERIELWNRTTGIIHYFIDELQPIVNMRFYGESGQVYNISGEKVSKSGGTLSVTGTFLAPENIMKVSISVSWNFKSLTNNTDTFALVGYFGESDFNQFVLSVAKADKSEELLEEQNGLIAQIISKIGQIASTIADLPQQIWNKIENGLMALFVPSEEVMVQYKDDWSNLMTDRFGAVAEVCDMVFNAWDDLETVQQTNYIEFPSVSIPLPDDNEFTLGPYQVQIVPTGFEGIAVTCRYISCIVATFLFVNGLRKRYDEVMGVEQ